MPYNINETFTFGGREWMVNRLDSHYTQNGSEMITLEARAIGPANSNISLNPVFISLPKYPPEEKPKPIEPEPEPELLVTRSFNNLIME